MSERNFRHLLEAQWARGKSVCVGIDSEFEKIPKAVSTGTPDSTMIAFNRAIIDATKDIACAYKLNSSFYEAQGDAGMCVLRITIEHSLKVAPDVPVILDAKRGDIGNSNSAYAEAAFDELGADAITVHPYLGGESLAPFLDRKDKGVFILCRTSNPDSGELQLQNIVLPDWKLTEMGGADMGTYLTGSDLKLIPFYKFVAACARYRWNKNGNCGLVVGATYHEELRAVRQIVGDMPILIPGIGAQGGDAEKTVSAGKNSRGQGMIINSSRGIIFASNGPDFAEAARRETLKLHDLIVKYSTAPHRDGMPGGVIA